MNAFKTAIIRTIVSGAAGCAVVCAVGCAALSPKRQVEVHTDPEGAEVLNRAGERLGRTPFTLEGETLGKALEGDRLFVLLQSPGYAERALLADVNGNDSVTLKLTKLDSDAFTRLSIGDFSPQINEITRELLRIQGLLLMRKKDEARRDLQAFQKKYPDIAASYVMLANAAVMDGNKAEALSYLKRARSIDPRDEVSARMLRMLEPAKGGGP